MDIKETVANHGEKLALGGAVLLAAVCVIFLKGGGEDPQVKALAAAADSVEKALEEGEKVMPAPTAAEELSAEWERISPAAPANNWTAYPLPTVKIEVRGTVKVDAKVVFPPTLKEPVVELGRVSLSWEDDSMNTASITGYEVARTEAGRNSWETLADSVTGTSFDDEKVVPKIVYTYRVRALTDTPGAERPRGEWSNEVGATAKDVLELRLVGTGSGSAFVEVRKFQNGKWNQKTFTVKKGELIGAVTKAIRTPKATEIDWSTGFTVADIQEVLVPRMIKKKKKVTENGVLVEKEVEESVNVKTWKLVYKDKAGKTFNLLLDDSARGGKAGGATKPPAAGGGAR